MSLPAISLPSGEPPTPDAEPTGDLTYAGDPDDPSGFLAAYRTTFPDVALGYDDGEILSIGLELCTYLLRQADGSRVALQDAITEADQSKPGFPRTEWASAFGLANQYLCPEFQIDDAGTGD